ncbi:unnamed protein product [Hermetia illucens]|uniref:DDE Tnp4 domain-containing protein n=1 Tax=Hermetia illucens TaxID=343691 RepID=A0A7R8UM70_HERIL|nr:unnamed protein product [Hermetia illucens]
MFIDSDSDSDLEDAILLYSAVLAESIKKQKKKRQNKSIYLKKRQKSGRFARDFQDLIKDPIRFCENFHMDVKTFQRILSMVTPYLKPKKMTRPTDGISPNQKLAAVLEYFACGSLQRHIASVYRISKQHFGKIIDEVSIALISALNEYIPPYDANVMINAANDFNYQWNFPNCVGSIDGKHIAIKCPPKAGSMFFNYKGYHSIVLLAVADAKYKFSYIDVGAYGSEGDAGVFSSSKLGKAMVNESLPFPPDAKIHDKRLPFFFVGDDAFPLGKRLIKPYVPKRNQMLEPDKTIFNYRVSRARRCVENAFGILCSRWYCLARTMFCSPDRAQKIVAACCYLHNFLTSLNPRVYCPTRYADYIDSSGNLIEGEWRNNIPANSLFSSTINPTQGRPTDIGKTTRVPWQKKITHQTNKNL